MNDPRHLATALKERSPEYWLNSIRANVQPPTLQYWVATIFTNQMLCYGSCLDKFAVDNHQIDNCFHQSEELRRAFEKIGVPYVYCKTDDALPNNVDLPQDLISA